MPIGRRGIEGFVAQNVPLGPYRWISAVRKLAYGAGDAGAEYPLLGSRAPQPGAYCTTGRSRKPRAAAVPTIRSRSVKSVGTPLTFENWPSCAAGTSAKLLYGWAAAQLKTTRRLSTPPATIRSI